MTTVRRFPLLPVLAIACTFAACGSAEDASLASDLDRLIDVPAPEGWQKGSCDPEHVLSPGQHMVGPETECETPECQYEQAAATLGGRFAGDPVTGERYYFDVNAETQRVFYSVCFPDTAEARELIADFASDPIVQSTVLRNRCADGSEYPAAMSCESLGLVADVFGVMHDLSCPSCNPCPGGRNASWHNGVLFCTF